MDDEPKEQSGIPVYAVTVRDVDVRFLSLAKLMVKAAFAVLPAGLIIYLGYLLLLAFVNSLAEGGRLSP